MNIEARLAELEARIAISELRSKYCWYTVRGLKQELVKLFTDDGVFQNSRNAEDDPVSVEGKESLLAYFARIKPARRIPLVTNEVVTVDGNHAEGTCAMLGVGEDSFCGHYIDTFRKVDGRWRFSVRRFFPYWPIYKPDPNRRHP